MDGMDSLTLVKQKMENAPDVERKLKAFDALYNIMNKIKQILTALLGGVTVNMWCLVVTGTIHPSFIVPTILLTGAAAAFAVSWCVSNWDETDSIFAEHAMKYVLIYLVFFPATLCLWILGLHAGTSLALFLTVVICIVAIVDCLGGFN